MGKVKAKNLTSKEVVDIENSFKSALDFINGVLRYFPNQDSEDETQPEKSSGGLSIKQLPPRLVPGRSQGKKPARTVEELQEKLSLLKGKTGLPYKDKLVKKGLQNRLKKKEKKEKRKLMHLEAKSQNQLKKSNIVEKKPATKPVYNTEGEIVFSKFDFSEFGAKADKKFSKTPIKDPVIALKKVKEEQKRLKELEGEGQVEKVSEIKEKKAWKKALLMSEGVKVKDDPELLKATIKKTKKRKEKSKAKWKINQSKVEKEKEERQRKRQANIDMRAKEKKLKKMKIQAKKGRIIAGF